MDWFDSSQKCVHCADNMTQRQFEGDATCQNCEIVIRINREETRLCPLDNEVMSKEVIEDTEIVIDRCTKCSGVWLDPKELEWICQEVDSSGRGFRKWLSSRYGRLTASNDS